LEVNVEELRAS
jgi:hypothetical protein